MTPPRYSEWVEVGNCQKCNGFWFVADSARFDRSDLRQRGRVSRSGLQVVIGDHAMNCLAEQFPLKHV